MRRFLRYPLKTLFIKELFFLFLALIPSLFCGERISVALPLSQPLIPLYLAKFSSRDTDLGKNYLEQLDQVFKFDLGHNGMTEVVPNDPQLEKTIQSGISDSGEGWENWKSGDVFYFIAPKVHGRVVSFYVFSTTSRSMKLIEGIQLTGDLSKDRQTLHKVADAIHAALFGKEGIASRRLVFTRKLKSGKEKSRSYLVETDWDGKNEKVLFDSNHLIVTPSLVSSKVGGAPIGCVYVSYELGQPKIFYLPLEGSGRHRVTYLKGNQLTPAISLKRDKLAFVNDSLGNPDLFLLELNEDGTAKDSPRRIYTFPKATQASPSFSPDGETIAFVSSKDGSTRIYVMKIPERGSSPKNWKPHLITTHHREASAPAWSPDGSKLAFCAKGSEADRQIWVYDFHKKEERQLTFGRGDKENPTWAPDSLHLIFNLRKGNESSSLYLMNLNQSEVVEIVKGPGENRFPSW